jgi:hypothetical protein
MQNCELTVETGSVGGKLVTALAALGEEDELHATVQMRKAEPAHVRALRRVIVRRA